ncbi:MAG: methyltransferase domain-containing protein [Alphaproteobacteria bacterium]
MANFGSSGHFVWRKAPDDRPSLKSGVSHDYICPACRAPLARYDESFVCAACGHEFPILFGIADLRLRSDKYLTLEQERDKARRLYEYGLEHSFDELVAFYYSITDDVPADLAKRYGAYVRAGVSRGERVLRSLSDGSVQGDVLDVGCASGGLLVAGALAGHRCVGVDIALRWLVICACQLREMGVKAELVCADVEALPFADETFDVVVATDLLENVYDIENALEAMAAALHPAGLLWLSGTNKFCVGPHPLVGIWAIGYLPGRLRRWLVTARHGIDSLRHVQLISPGGIALACRRVGLEVCQVAPQAVSVAGYQHVTSLARTAVRLYSALRTVPVVRTAMVLLGPVFEMTCVKPANLAGGR